MTRYDFCGEHNKAGLSIVAIDGKFGVYNTFKDKEIISPKYDDLRILDDHCFAVKVGNYWGAIISNDEAIAYTRFEEITNFNPKYILLKLKHKHLGLMAKDGSSTTTRCSYSVIRNFVNGFSIVQRKERWGVIDENLNEVIPANYFWIQHFKDNLFFAIINSKMVVMDSAARIKKQLDYTSITKLHNLPFYIVKKDELYGVVNMNLEEVVPTTYTHMTELKDGFLYVFLDNKAGIIHVDKGTLIDLKYRSVRSLGNGFFAVENRSKKRALFDTTGTQLTEFKYEDLDLIDHTILAIVPNENDPDKVLVGILDNSGKEVLYPIYDDIKKIGDGYAVMLNGKYGICDSQYHIVSKFVFDEVHEIIEYTKIGKKLAKVIYNGRYGSFYW